MQVVRTSAATGEGIADLAALVSDTVGFDGRLQFDPSKPDGTPRKLLDVSRLSELGWQPEVSLADGVSRTYEWFASNYDAVAST